MTPVVACRSTANRVATCSKQATTLLKECLCLRAVPLDIRYFTKSFECIAAVVCASQCLTDRQAFLKQQTRSCEVGDVIGEISCDDERFRTRCSWLHRR